MARSSWIGASAIAGIALASSALNCRLTEPPRYDGAGYAVLARSIVEGRGYREIDHPEAPRHAHFPPGYPIFLAALWAPLGPSISAAHVASIACTVLASVAAWAWFRRLYPSRVALLMGASVAVNWSWGRVGGSIQSEPLFLLLEMLAILAASRIEAGKPPNRDDARGIGLGVLLGACVLTRHVGASLALAVLAGLMIGRKFRAAAWAAVSILLAVAPWAAWLISVGRGTQVGLLPRSRPVDVVLGNALFYIRRIPDLLIGPVVEVGTVFHPGWRVPATALAAVASAVVAFGWWRSARSPRRRLAGRVAWATLGLLLIWPFTEAGRFLIPLVPILLIGAVEGLGRAIPPRMARRPRAWAAGLLLVVSLPYPIYAIASGRAEAARRAQSGFDLACARIAADTDRPGPVLGRHPGEIFWQTGRTSLAPPEDDPGAIGPLIDRYGVAFLLVDDDRFARAPTSPLGRFARDHPGRVDRVGTFGSVEVFAVRRGRLGRKAPARIGNRGKNSKF